MVIFAIPVWQRRHQCQHHQRHHGHADDYSYRWVGAERQQQVRATVEGKQTKNQVHPLGTESRAYSRKPTGQVDGDYICKTNMGVTRYSPRANQKSTSPHACRLQQVSRSTYHIEPKSDLDLGRRLCWTHQNRRQNNQTRVPGISTMFSGYQEPECLLPPSALVRTKEPPDRLQEHAAALPGRGFLWHR